MVSPALLVSACIFSSLIRSVTCETIPSLPTVPSTNNIRLERATSLTSTTLLNSETTKINSDHSSLEKRAIQALFDDLKNLDSQPITRLTTPCVDLCRDRTYTRIWSLEDWESHTKHALVRYARHLHLWPNSTTMKSIISAVIVSTCWSFMISLLGGRFGVVQNALSKFTVTLTFIQAPILLLLTLRTNRSLDRLLESRKAWGALSKATRSFMGLICWYVIPKHPFIGCIMARHLCICGWVLKGMLRNEDDLILIKGIMKSVPEEADWILRQNEAHGMKSPHAVVCRLRSLLSSLHEDLPPVILLRMEEIIYDIESTFGVCNRITTSPIPPTYTRHTSRVLVVYLSLLPLALVGMGVTPGAVVITCACVSYILIGIDEIGLEIEYPFPLMPLFGLSQGIQKEVTRYVKQNHYLR